VVNGEFAEDRMNAVTTNGGSGGLGNCCTGKGEISKKCATMHQGAVGKGLAARKQRPQWNRGAVSCQGSAGDGSLWPIRTWASQRPAAGLGPGGVGPATMAKNDLDGFGPVGASRCRRMCFAVGRGCRGGALLVLDARKRSRTAACSTHPTPTFCGKRELRLTERDGYFGARRGL